jgi:hypothetical protein
MVSYPKLFIVDTLNQPVHGYRADISLAGLDEKAIETQVKELVQTAS